MHACVRLSVQSSVRPSIQCRKFCCCERFLSFLSVCCFLLVLLLCMVSFFQFFSGFLLHHLLLDFFLPLFDWNQKLLSLPQPPLLPTIMVSFYTRRRRRSNNSRSWRSMWWECIHPNEDIDERIFQKCLESICFTIYHHQHHQQWYSSFVDYFFSVFKDNEPETLQMIQVI